MRFVKLMVAAASALVYSINALDYMAVLTQCTRILTPWGPYGCHVQKASYYKTSTGHYFNNAGSGCYNTGVPNSKFHPSLPYLIYLTMRQPCLTSHPTVVEFCLDWGNSRAHFRFNNQNKRCMKLISQLEMRWSCVNPDTACLFHNFAEVPCTWATANSIPTENVAAEIGPDDWRVSGAGVIMPEIPAAILDVGAPPLSTTTGTVV